MKARRKFSREFKQTAVRQLAGGKSAAEVARALEVHPSDLYRWRRELEEHGADAFIGAGRKRADDDRVALTGQFSAPGRWRLSASQPANRPLSGG